MTETTQDIAIKEPRQRQQNKAVINSKVVPRDIPKGWDVLKFGEIFDFISSYSFSRNQLDIFNNQNDPLFYIHYGDIHAKFAFQVLDIEKEILNIPILGKVNDLIKEENLLEEGDLIIADASEDYNGVGECIEIKNLGGRKIIGGLHTFVARDKANLTSLGYRAYLLLNPKVSIELKKLATGSKVYGISKSNLAKLKIPLPPLAEQQKIAQILSTWDKAIANLEQLITQKQTLKKGLMQQLLSGKLRFKEFIKSNKMKKSKLGMVPEDWEYKSLNEVSNIKTGNTPSTRQREFYGSDILFVSPVDMGDFKYITKTEKKLTFLGFKKARQFPEKSILYTCIGSTIGKIGLASESLSCNQQINVILPNDNFDSVFVYYELIQMTPRIRLIAGEQAVPIINKSTFEKIEIKFPSINEQHKIAKTLSSVDKEIELLQAELQQWQTQKKGLMQKLLTGEVRVIVE